MDYVKELRKLVGTRPLILPGSVVIMINNDNQILLQHRRDGSWGLPGGIMELGESLEDTARREVKEETGLTIGDLELLNVFSGPDYYLKVPNGDELYSVTAVYLTRDIQGEINMDKNESIDLRYFNLDGLPDDLTPEAKNYMEPYLQRVNK
ncbi:NUDIX hydrolase [Oceanobacillus jeddahense]|uniref:NUDIX hydrolase n=1 Tax=Oceanobacillus jeddahense TaxID=1462527 RepID=A0ABY5K147_9BACI|nr:NUDIX hydrolase [Oceanobacillus jeddahense]UUI04852.1 NUDIX hydrolase [Oceanobacillus jeddahense]